MACVAIGQRTGSEYGIDFYAPPVCITKIPYGVARERLLNGEGEQSKMDDVVWGRVARVERSDRK